METIGLVCLYGITAFDDIRTKQVRLIEIIIFGIIGLVINWIWHPNSIASLLGGIGIGIFSIALSVATKEKIGLGDAYIILVTGIYIGFMNTAILLWMSSIFATIYGIIAIRKYDNKDIEIPFVPFLLLGYLVMFVVGVMRGIL